MVVLARVRRTGALSGGATGRRVELIPRPRGVALHFYQGKVLRIDLGAGTAAIEPLNMEWAERYVGGKGLLFRYMWEYVPSKVDPWAPENPIFLVTGPFAGTNVSTASRLVVGAKSPVTGILDDSYVGDRSPRR